MAISAFADSGVISSLGKIKTVEDFEFFMEIVYKMNPDKTKEEIDEVIRKGVQEKQRRTA